MSPAVKTPPSENGVQPEDDNKVLDLTALTPSRRLVKLPTKRTPAGENFELRLIDDFGIEMQQKLLAWGRQYQRLMNSDEELTEDEASRLKFLLDQIFETVLDAPKAVKSTITDAVKGRVMTTFSMGPLIARQEAQMEVIRRLVEAKKVKQEDVDAIMEQIRAEVAQSTLAS